MASTFSQIKFGLDEVAKAISRNRGYIDAARKNMVLAQTNLAAMSSLYSTLVQDINQAAIDNSSDSAYLMAKSEKDKLVADFQSLKSYVDDLIAAYDGVAE